MLMTVEEFRARVSHDLPSLVAELREKTGRDSPEEIGAWQAALPKLARTLAHPTLSSVRIYLAGAVFLTLEYQLPAAASWCDVVLLGRRAGRPHALIIELKHWATWGDRPGPAEGLVVRQGILVTHPSEQVRGYVEYCRHFHSSVHKHGAAVSGCVLFTGDYLSDAYMAPPNDRLVQKYPCFHVETDVVGEALPRYLSASLEAGDKAFAEDFVSGTYEQDRGFLRQVGKQILSPERTPFVLLDNQRLAFNVVKSCVEKALFSAGAPEKQVILIEGPPGSGKSVLAAKIWASLILDTRLPRGSVVITTTSTSQNSNWGRLFERAAGSKGGRGAVKKASSYVPLTTHRLGKLRERYGSNFLQDPGQWRQNLRELQAKGVHFPDGARDNQYLVSIVDEAHALINPERPEGRGQFGFPPNLGPLAWHIIRASRVSVFLLDQEQGFRDRENTTKDDIALWARELGATVTDRISLEGSQFRCAGSAEFVEWLERVLRGDCSERTRALSRLWRSVLDFRVCDSPFELEEALRTRIREGRSARLVASYARPWKTRGKNEPHRLPPSEQDFYIECETGGRRRFWSRVWNYVPNGSDYTFWVQAPPGSPMALDPLCEVGCPYAVRGFDFDYVGVLWLGDLVFRNGRWEAALEHVHESGLARTLQLAQKGLRPAYEELRKSLAKGYRILLTRGIYGVYLWFEDQSTRAFIESTLG